MPTIDASKWYSLTQKERAQLTRLGVRCDHRIISAHELPIVCVMSEAGLELFNDSTKFASAGVAVASDKHMCNEHLEHLQAIVSRAADGISGEFGSFMNSCNSTDGVNGGLALLAGMIHRSAALGIVTGHQTEDFGTYVLRTDWSQATPAARDFFDVNFFVKTPQQAGVGQLMAFADMADALQG